MTTDLVRHTPENIAAALDEIYTIEPHGRFFAVYQNREHLLWEEVLSGPPEKRLICVCVYKIGAEEVKRRLTAHVQLRTRTIFWRPAEGFRGDPDLERIDEPGDPDRVCDGDDDD